MKRLLASAALAAMIGTGAVAVTATPAAATIVCNAAGDCWHVDRSYRYRRELRLERHPDDWYFHRHWDADKDHHWREYHEGRGYYDHGVWTPF